MIRARFTSRLAGIAFLGSCSTANAIDFEVLPPDGILEWAAVVVGLFFFAWGIREFVVWARRRGRNRRQSSDEPPRES